MPNSESTYLDLEQIKLRIMQIKLRDEENTKELLEIADSMQQMHVAGNSPKAQSYLAHKKSIRDASSTRIYTIESIDSDITGDLMNGKVIDDRADRRIRRLIPGDN